VLEIEADKYSREVEVGDGAALSRTTTGKIQRFVLRDLEQRRRGGSAATRA
jgi:acyl-coenzyme A synthetase/AMP-(fatty) acid ligase